jgi:hypothetical protein
MKKHWFGVSRLLVASCAALVLISGHRAFAGIPLQEQIKKQVAFTIKGTILKKTQKDNTDEQRRDRTFFIKVTHVKAHNQAFSHVLTPGKTIRFASPCSLGAKQKGGWARCQSQRAILPTALQKKKGATARLKLAVLRGAGGILFAIVVSTKQPRQLVKGTLANH